jgi:hypothetical protein
MSYSASASRAATLGSLPSRVGDRLGEPLARVVPGVGLEDRPDPGGQQPVLVAAGVAKAIVQELNRAALPGAAKQPGDRRLEPLVGVRDDELHALEAAGQQRAQELGSEGLGLGLADVEGEDLPPAALVHAVGVHDRFADDAAAVPDLLDRGNTNRGKHGAAC